MNCKKCGAELKPGASFCGKCGTKQDFKSVNISKPITPPPINNNKAPYTPPNNAGYKKTTVNNTYSKNPYAGGSHSNPVNNNNSGYNIPPYSGGNYNPVPPTDKNGHGILSGNKNKKIGMIVCAAGAVVIIVIAVILFNTIFGGGYKGIYEDYFKSVKKEDAEIYMDLFPKEAQEVFIDSFGSEKEAIREIKKELKDEKKDFEEELGDNWKVSFECENIDKYDKDELDDFISDNEELFYYLEMDEEKIKKVYEIDMKITFKGENDEENGMDTFLFIKYKGKWYSLDLLEEFGETAVDNNY